MIAKCIGYLIGGMFIVAFLAPIPAAVWLVYDRIDVYLNSSIESATITRCYSRRSSGANSRLSFGPVAKTDNALEIKGDFTWSKRKWCESDIGDRVSVLVNEKDAGNSRIFTFIQFWALPLLFVFISFVLYPAMYIVKRNKTKKSTESQ